jgi:hypothetical protein
MLQINNEVQIFVFCQLESVRRFFFDKEKAVCSEKSSEVEDFRKKVLDNHMNYSKRIRQVALSQANANVVKNMFGKKLIL